MIGSGTDGRPDSPGWGWKRSITPEQPCNGANNASIELGWGRAGETWQCIETLEALGGASWFRLGDKDLALHLHRSELMRGGATLTQATEKICQAMNITHQVLPMSDDPVATIVHSDQGPLAFQHYFVREQCAPEVTGFEFTGVAEAQVNTKLALWLEQCDGVIICPSNPFVSVDPLLALPGMRERLAALPVIAVSPIVGGIAIKGPAAKMMAELDMPASAAAVARHYEGLINGFVLDDTDAQQSSEITPPTLVCNTIMDSLQTRIRLAEDCVAFLKTVL